MGVADTGVDDQHFQPGALEAQGDGLGFQAAAVEEYIQQTLRQSDIQRESADKEKTGVAGNKGAFGSLASKPTKTKPFRRPAVKRPVAATIGRRLER